MTISLSRIFSVPALRESTPDQKDRGAGRHAGPTMDGPPAAGSQIMGMPQPQSSGVGTRITGDAATLGALENLLSDVRDEAMYDWADEARDAISAAIRKGGDQITATLPPFKATGQEEDEGDLE